MKNKKYAILKQLFLYGIIGGISSSVDTILFTLFITYFYKNYLVANCISVFIGILISFILNLFINFKTFDNILSRFLSFLTIGLFGLIISSFILSLGNVMEIDIFVVKIISIVIVAAIQFILNKFISFKQREETYE